MMRLAARVKRLTEYAGGAICPVCGGGAGVPVAFVSGDTPRDMHEPTETEYCPGCGRVTRFTITFDGLDAE
jgi:rRNA maturation protein Nop10